LTGIFIEVWKFFEQDTVTHSASITLKALKTKGYVDEDENKFLRFSQEGEKLSDSIKFRRLLLYYENFLVI